MKRFNYDEPKKPVPQTATKKKAEHPGVQREHILMMAHIWNHWVPVFDPDITPEIASAVWEHFVVSPTCRSGDVITMRVLTSRIWNSWVALN